MIYARLLETIAIFFTRRGILLTRLVESYALRVRRSAFSVALVIDWRTTGEYQSSQLLIGMLLWIMMATSASTEAAITPEDLPPWLKPELLIHIAAMDMNELQNIEISFRCIYYYTECL